MSTNMPTSPTKIERATLHDGSPGVIVSLVTKPKLTDCPEVTSWIKKMMDYNNLAGGENVRGLTTKFAYETLEKPEKITEESLQAARILGWCVEMLQAYVLVIDDIIEQSTLRRGMPCWYTLPEVGTRASNDTSLIISSMFQTLKTYFSDHPHYARIIQIFNEALLSVSAGQHLDSTLSRNNDLSLFTINKYDTIVKYKKTNYTYNVPVQLGLLLANIFDKETHRKADEICVEIGKLFQMQDDYIDCFGEEAVTDKVGSDIQKGKCTWLAVEALRRCSEAQRRVFSACYGSREPAHVARVRRLYEKLQLPQLYRQQQDEIRENIVREVRKLPATLAPNLFLRLVDIIYERKQ